MRIFGNLTNRIMESAPQPIPTIGTLATICSWSDRNPARVIEVSPTGHRIRLAMLPFKIADYSGTGTVDIDAPPSACTGHEIAHRMKDGSYRVGGRSGNGVAFGRAEAYRDPHF